MAAKKRAKRSARAAELMIPAPPRAMVSTLDATEQLRAIVDAQIARLNDEDEAKLLTEAQRIKIATAAAQTLATLGRMTGETLEITDAKLVKLPAFRRVVDVMVRTLTPWPEAMHALGLALTKIAQGDRTP